MFNLCHLNLTSISWFTDFKFMSLVNICIKRSWICCLGIQLCVCFYDYGKMYVLRLIFQNQLTQTIDMVQVRHRSVSSLVYLPSWIFIKTYALGLELIFTQWLVTHHFGTFHLLKSTLQLREKKSFISVSKYTSSPWVIYFISASKIL